MVKWSNFLWEVCLFAVHGKMWGIFVMVKGSNMIQGASPGRVPILFAIRVDCVVIWPIFSTSKIKAFCIYFYQGNITFKNIINLVSFIINLVEYVVINSYSVTVLDNYRRETSDRANKHIFVEVFNSLTFILGNLPTSMVCHLASLAQLGEHLLQS